MGKRKWSYEGCIHFHGTDMLTDLYLESLGWVWDREEMDYVTDDVDLLNYTVGIDCYIGDILFEMDEDEIVSKVLAACNYNNEEDLINTIRVQLSKCLEQGLPELSGDIKEEVRQALLQSKVYDGIKRKVDEQVININLADKIRNGVTNTEWTGSRREFVDIIRRGLKVTTLTIHKSLWEFDYMAWVVPAVHTAIREELYKNGYTAIQVDGVVKRLLDGFQDTLRDLKLTRNDWEVELKVLIIPIGLNGFDEDDRVHILTGDTYQYLKSNNIVY